MNDAEIKMFLKNFLDAEEKLKAFPAKRKKKLYARGAWIMKERLNNLYGLVSTDALCGDGKINAVVDWTTACVHPVVWEIVRSYVYAAPSCKNGEINMDEIASYVSEYQRFAALNEYDLQWMIPLFYYQIAVCDYYGQYYVSTAANRHIYLHQAIFSTKLLRWLEKDSAVVKPLDLS